VIKNVLNSLKIQTNRAIEEIDQIKTVYILTIIYIVLKIVLVEKIITP